MFSTKSQNKKQQIWDAIYHPPDCDDNLNKVRENTDKFIEDYDIKKKIQMNQKIMYKINLVALGEPKDKNDRTDYRYSPKYSCKLEFDHIQLFKTEDSKTIIVTSPYIPEIQTEKYMDYFNARGFTKIPGLYVHECPSYVCIV
jgi:hypothetical protein